MVRNKDTTESELENESQTSAPDKVAIEGNLPLTPIDIESQKDMMSGRYHPLRSLHKWFAARPTPAARLAVIASIYPDKINANKLLSLLQIGPNELDEGIADYVETKFNQNQTGSGTLDDHYGYPNPNTQTPTETEVEDLHETLRRGWDGELPTVLDPTCGRGIIPFEAMRYGIPVVANELNPIPTVISKVAIEYAPEIGSVTPEIYKWREKIQETAKENIERYYPTKEENREILNSAFTYIIECNSCGGKIPLVKGWWVNKTRGGDVTVPQYIDGDVVYSHIKEENIPNNITEDIEHTKLNISERLIENTLNEIPIGENEFEPTSDMNIYIDKDDVKEIKNFHSYDNIKKLRSSDDIRKFIRKKLICSVLNGYDPDAGPVSRGDAKCPHCGAVTDSDTIRQKIRNSEFEYSIYGVNYQTQDGEDHFRAGSEIDQKGMRLAQERIESDFDMMDFLSEPITTSSQSGEIHRMGMKQWRDIFTPRQLVVHYEYLQAFRKYKPDIQEEYNASKAKTILTILTFGASRAVQANTKLSKWRNAYGYGQDMFADNNYAVKKMAGDGNLSSDRKGYVHFTEHIIDSYESLAKYAQKSNKTQVINSDASVLKDNLDGSSVDVAVVDPPYYSSIMYAELSDVFYVIQKRYLRDLYPELFNSKLSNKDDEAVANPSRFDELADSGSSKKQMADEFYEQKMEEIFDEIYDTLSDNGVMTVMFTHREMDAWDTLTSALIKSGFVITATHPVKTEKTDRIGVQGDDSADSSILLTARKESDSDANTSSLWSDIKDEIYATAEDEAKDIINSEYHISKTDTAIAAYGPTLKEFVKAHPVVDKNGKELRPREALSEARQAVTSVLVEEYLNVNGVDTIDSLTRWYILIWLIYENDTVISDEARQIGRAADIDIDDVDARSDTKIWGKSSGDVQLKDPSERVQDIVKLESEEADDPSSSTYPVDPTGKSFQNAIDAVHSAVHVYDREGSDRTLQWLKERNMNMETEFHITIIALLETMPSGNDIRETLQQLVQGQTGEYLDIDLTTFSSTADPQTDVSEWIDDDNE